MDPRTLATVREYVSERLNASPQAVSAALAELRAVTGFTLWFAARLERTAWRAIGMDF
jgi:hypothetical protein